MKNSKEKHKITAKPEKSDGISKRGVKVILTGVVVFIAGFFILTKTGPFRAELGIKTLTVSDTRRLRGYRRRDTHPGK